MVMPASYIYAFFIPDFPNDTVWDEEADQPIAPGGQNVMQAICDGLRRRGHECDELEQRGSGWQTRFRLRGRRISVWVDGVADFIEVGTHIPLLRALLGERAQSLQDEAVRLLTDVMIGDGRFHGPDWISAPSIGAAEDEAARRRPEWRDRRLHPPLIDPTGALRDRMIQRERERRRQEREERRRSSR
jgi:hypothetical protein